MSDELQDLIDDESVEGSADIGEDPQDGQPAPRTEHVLTLENIGGLQVRTADEAIEYLNILVYGESGVGKTLLAGSSAAVEEMCPVLCVDFEAGTLTLKNKYNVDVVRVQSFLDMGKVYNYLYDNPNVYKTVIIDSLTEMQKLSMLGIMLELRKEKPDADPDVPGIREWGKNTEQMRKMVRAFRDLPMNTIFTALAATDRDPKTGSKLTKPQLSGKLGAEVAGFLDVVMYYYMKVIDGNPTRLLLAQSTGETIAKDRTSLLPQMLVDGQPDPISMLTIHNIINHHNT